MLVIFKKKSRMVHETEVDAEERSHLALSQEKPAVPKRLIASLIFLLAWPLLMITPALSGQKETAPNKVADLLEPIRQKHRLPALCGAGTTISPASSSNYTV